MSCHASPVTGQDLHPSMSHKAEKTGGKGKDLQIEEGWLSLGMPGSSATESKGKEVQIDDNLFAMKSQTPSTTAQLPSFSSSHPLANTLAERSQRWAKKKALSKMKFNAQQLGQEKKKDREVWKEAHPGKLPPIRYLSHSELVQMGLDALGTKYKAAHYLEEMKMRMEEVKLPRFEVEKPVVKYRLQPLTKTPIIDGNFNQFLFDKQAEIDQLLDDDGLLVTSSDNKRKSSDLYRKGRKFPRPEESTSSSRGHAHDTP